MFLITVTGSFNEVMINIALLSALSMAVEITLARIGIKLMYAHMPG